MSSPAASARSRARASIGFDTSTPVVRAPRCANSSVVSPQPQPTSSTLSPAPKSHTCMTPLVIGESSASIRSCRRAHVAPASPFQNSICSVFEVFGSMSSPTALWRASRHEYHPAEGLSALDQRVRLRGFAQRKALVDHHLQRAAREILQVPLDHSAHARASDLGTQEYPGHGLILRGEIADVVTAL